MKRISCIDTTRGIVMMIMALDHTRDLLHIKSVTQSPTDLSTTTPALFFTRWITYLCAPIFVFLAGTSVYLALRKKIEISRSRQFLLKRGLWLILLELTVVNFGLFFDIGFHILLFEVIATVGFDFIILSWLLKVRPMILLGIGLIIIFGHDLFSLFPTIPGSDVSKFVLPFLSLTPLPLSSGHFMLIAYPPVPWLGIMLAGFGCGKLFEVPGDKRKAIFLRIGTVCLLLFVFVRFINIYGDPVSWSVQKSAIFTILSFMNITKYPPSLLFTLVTLGIMFLVLAIVDGKKKPATDVAEVYGKVPLFYFIVHFYLIHMILIGILSLQGIHWVNMSFASGSFGRPKGGESGIPLWMVYLVWAAVVAALYKPCVWFGKYKANNNFWWLRYI